MPLIVMVLDLNAWFIAALLIGENTNGSGAELVAVAVVVTAKVAATPPTVTVAKVVLLKAADERTLTASV